MRLTGKVPVVKGLPEKKSVAAALARKGRALGPPTLRSHSVDGSLLVGMGSTPAFQDRTGCLIPPPGSMHHWESSHSRCTDQAGRICAELAEPALFAGVCQAWQLPLVRRWRHFFAVLPVDWKPLCYAAEYPRCLTPFVLLPVGQPPAQPDREWPTTFQSDLAAFLFLARE